MKEFKKGTGHQDTAPKHTHHYISRFDATCLLLFILGIFTCAIGYSDKVDGFGIGLLFATMMFVLYDIKEKEDGDEFNI